MIRPVFVISLLLCAGAVFAQEHAHHHPATPALPPQSTDPHAGHRMPPETPPESTSDYRPPVLTDADRAAAFPLLHAAHAHAHGDPLLWMLQTDRFEYTQGDALAWESSAWIGHDRGRLWLRSEGERAHGKTESASLEALWGTPVDAWWDVLAGVRHDAGHGPARDWLAVGVQGLAPYKFEVQITAYLGNGGRSMLQAEAEYEVLLTNKLILQPRIEATAYGRDDPQRGVGAGLAETSVGLRLRYDIRREFAPYLGYEWSRKYGHSADFSQAAGENPNTHGWVAGVRFWF